MLDNHIATCRRMKLELITQHVQNQIKLNKSPFVKSPEILILIEESMQKMKLEFGEKNPLNQNTKTKETKQIQIKRFHQTKQNWRKC